MHAKNSFISYIITLAIFCALTACSDSNTPEKKPTPLIEQAMFPFIQENALYNFDPTTGLKEKLAESNKSLMVELDIDQSQIVIDLDDESETILEHTPLPEHIVYVEDQTLRVYDLHTRYDHLLISFAASDEQQTNEFICDLKPSITVDEEHLDRKEILFKNNLSVYIKTSMIEACTGDATSFKYFEIKIEKSFTETFKVRRTTLKEHKHNHHHQHEHDYDHEEDHDGNHNHAEDEGNGPLPDGHIHDSEGHEFKFVPDPENPELHLYRNEVPHDHNHSDSKKPGARNKLHVHKHAGDDFSNRKLHDHEHEHTHDFDYIIMDEHKFNDDVKTSADAVHNDPKNQETVTETHRKLVGKKYVTEQAIMYSGNPIVDTQSERFGYLGFNHTDPEFAQAAYKFFELNEDDLKLYPTWTMTNSEFAIQPEDQQGYIDTSFSDAVMIEFNWKIVKWDLVDLFDDDTDTIREFSIDNPIFIRSIDDDAPYNRANYSINETTNAIAIYEVTEEETTQENKEFYYFPINDIQSFQRTILDDNIENLDFTLHRNHIITLKEFSEDPNELGHSTTSIDLSNTLEHTITRITKPTLLNLYSDDTFAISTQDESNPVWRSNYYDINADNIYTIDRENILWGSILDKRPIPNTTEFVPTLVISDTIAESPDTTVTALFEPNVHLYEQGSLNGQGKILGTIPTLVSTVNKAFIYNDLFAKITIRETFTSPETRKTYYFNPDDATSEMQLMYEEVFNE